MKALNTKQIFIKNFFLIKMPKYKWGALSFYNVANISLISKKYGFLNQFLLFLNLKKLASLICGVSFNHGICLSYFLDHHKKKYRIRNYKVKNFYIVYINKMFSFLSNFSYFVKNLKKYKRYTNYKTKRYPSIIFLSKKVWKKFDCFISIFIKLRLISIKSNSFLESEFFGTYNIVIGKCFSFYLMVRAIYFMNNLKFKKW